MSPPANGSFPPALLSLSDGELSAVMAAAGGLQQCDRPAFLEMLAAHVAALPEVGPGVLHRCVRQILGDMRRSIARGGSYPPPERRPILSALTRKRGSVGRPRRAPAEG